MTNNTSINLQEKFKRIDHYDFQVDDLINNSINKGIYVGELIEEIIKGILSKYFTSDIPLYAYMLREIMRNVPEHSESSSMSLDVYTDNQYEIAFKVSDNGIGIMKSLVKNPIYSRINDDEQSFLIISLKPGVTKTYKKDLAIPPEWRNSGFGLYMVSSIAQHLGSFEIYSGNVGLKINSNFPSIVKIRKIKGTTVILIVDKRKGKEAFSKVKEYSIIGQKYIRSHNIFSHYAVYKTASMASTLIDDNQND